MNITKRIIARLDAKQDKLIKGINLEGWRIIGDLKEYAKKYYLHGADEILIIDSVASLYNREKLKEVIKKITKDVFIPITVGGGIRTFKDAVDFLSGADKIAINSAAIISPNIIKKLALSFGSQSIVSSIPGKKYLKGNGQLITESAREDSNMDVIEWAKKCQDLGAGEILITSVDQDGTEKGYDLELAKEISKNISVPIIFSGGYGNFSDLISLNKIQNIDAFCIGTSLHKNLSKIKGIKSQAKKKNILIR